MWRQWVINKIKIVAPLLILGAILISCMVFFQYMLARTLYTEVEDKLIEVTFQSKALVEQRIHQIYDRLDAVGRLIGPDDVPDEIGLQRFKAENQLFAGFRMMGVVSVQGKVLYGDPLPIDAGNRLMDTFRGYNRVYCLPAGELISNQDALLFVVPLWHGDNIAGAVYGVIAGDDMQNILAGEAFEKNGMMFSSSRDFQTVIADSRQTELLPVVQGLLQQRNDSLLYDLYRKLYYKGYGVEKFVYDGSDYYVAAAALPELEDWYINSVVPASHVSDALQKILLATAATYIALSMIFLFAIWVIGRNKRKNQAELMRLAYEDELTGLPNWAAMQCEKKAAALQENAALAIIDIDEFSDMNYFMGREYCDRLLLKTADVFRRLLEANEMVCRVRGDRFVLYLQNQSRLLARIHEMMQQVRLSAKSYPVVLSCGVRILQAGSHLSEAYEDAVAALKFVKLETKSKIAVYNDEMGQRNRRNKKMEADLSAALKNRELKVMLQPKYSLKQDNWAGSEALVRWIHPELGLIQPEWFVKLLEANGDIDRLELYMLEEVCRLIRRWLDEGRKVLPVSVNLSRVHFANVTLVESILHIVNKYQVPFELIELEVTESAFFTHENVMLGKLHELHVLGFRLSIDDFGVGYSSLSELERIPASVIKLDKTFVDNWMDKKESCLIADIVKIARHIGLLVVIEGVETAEQCAMAKAAGCDIVQGFYYAKPLAVNDYETLVYGGSDDEKIDD